MELGREAWNWCSPLAHFQILFDLHLEVDKQYDTYCMLGTTLLDTTAFQIYPMRCKTGPERLRTGTFSWPPLKMPLSRIMLKGLSYRDLAVFS
jgi:hypothetical protein